MPLIPTVKQPGQLVLEECLSIHLPVGLEHSLAIEHLSKEAMQSSSKYYVHVVPESPQDVDTRTTMNHATRETMAVSHARKCPPNDTSLIRECEHCPHIESSLPITSMTRNCPVLYFFFADETEFFYHPYSHKLYCKINGLKMVG